MPIYEEKIKQNGKLIAKLVDGKKQYYIRTYVDGKQITRHNKKWLGRDGLTLAKEEEIRLINNLVFSKIDNNEISFGEILDKYKEEIMKITKESTYYSYFNVIESQITPYFNNKLKMSKCNTDLFLKWHEVLERKNLSIRYMNKCHQIMCCILDIGIKYFGLKNNYERIIGAFKNNNSEIVKDEEKLKYVTYEDFNKFISTIDNFVWKTFFIFLYYTGMRKGEVQALNWNDIDFDNNEIIVNKTLTVKTTELYKITSTKNYKNRKIKMSKILREQLLLYKKEMEKCSDFDNDWFVFGCTRFMPQTTIDRKKHFYFELCNVEEITINQFRHSHVSLLINEYVKSGQTDTTKFFLMMSNRMGHTIEVMQETYMHLFDTIQDEIVNLLDRL